MIKRITGKEAFGIIITRKPLGKFFKIDNVTDKYLGIDNTTGDAWVEEFEDIEECIAWLNGEKYYVDTNEKEIYRQAIEKWGDRAQITMLFEEMAELQNAVCKQMRGRVTNIDIAEEVADVEIMLEQMKLIFSIENDVEEWKCCKIRRLAKRLEE